MKTIYLLLILVSLGLFAQETKKEISYCLSADYGSYDNDGLESFCINTEDHPEKMQKFLHAYESGRDALFYYFDFRRDLETSKLESEILSLADLVHASTLKISLKFDIDKNSQTPETDRFQVEKKLLIRGTICGRDRLVEHLLSDQKTLAGFRVFKEQIKTEIQNCNYYKDLFKKKNGSNAIGG